MHPDESLLVDAVSTEWMRDRQLVAVVYEFHEISSRQSVVKADGCAVPLPGR
jgi:hypothetical protein